MSRQQLPPQIKRVEVLDRKTGKTAIRYRVTVDAGKDADGKRRQVRRHYATEKAAKGALAKIQADSAAGTFVPKAALTVDQACADWLAGRHSIRQTTLAAYTHALQPLRDRHGEMAVQKLAKTDIDVLVADLMAGRAEEHGKWTANSINPMLNLISRVLADLVRQGALVRDVAALVDRVKRPKKAMATFTDEEIRQVLAHVDGDRLGHAWHLALSGLRRGEIGGLLWSDVDLEAGMLTVRRNRVSVNGAAVETEDTKTERSARTLPLTPALSAVLRRASAIQKAERLKLGPAYGPGEHVVCNEAGEPYHPDSLSGFWQAMCVAAKVPPIRLYDARHTCASTLAMQGVPIAVVSAWLGHADPAFTLRTYVHAGNDALQLAAASLQRVCSEL